MSVKIIYLKRQDFANTDQGFEVEIETENYKVISVKKTKVMGAVSGAGEQFPMIFPFALRSFAAYFLINGEVYILIHDDIYKMSETKFSIFSESSLLLFFAIKVRTETKSRWYWGFHPAMKFDMHSSIIDILRLVIKGKLSAQELAKHYITA